MDRIDVGGNGGVAPTDISRDAPDGGERPPTPTLPRKGGREDAVNRLCRELRPHAQLLVDAFGIPEVLLPPLASAPVAIVR